MSGVVDDGYESYYAERLWQMLPGVYRSADTDSLTEPGPLRELLERIAAQVAVVRRSIDRLWADQSIETCDDWVIPYVGDLLGTNLVNHLDPAGQRLDVAKTIHYRRRKGTLPVLEELAHDVTGWPAHVVEAFRRLGRTRHGLDPAVGAGGYPQTNPGDLAQLLQIEGLRGALTGGLAGGFADLRSPHGSALADGPFDEAFHTADLRVGRGARGHFGIPKLLVFLWRLRSFAVAAGDPVAVKGCANQFVFDPTGREVPLFLPMPKPRDDFADTWTPAREVDVPGPLTASLWDALHPTATSPPAPPYPSTDVPSPLALGNGAALNRLWPELGRFETKSATPVPTVDYHYGFPGTVGAGPYDRTLLGDPPAVVGHEQAVHGGTGLDTALAALSGSAHVRGTVTIGDSRTYHDLADLGHTAHPIVAVLVRAGASERPVLRPAAAGAEPWIFTGAGGAELVLDGLTVCGRDVILRGSFASVRITACTLDPGTAADTPLGHPPLATAADGELLAPCHLWIEGDPDPQAAGPGAIQHLLVDRSVTGPIRTRFGGSVETLTVTDSVVQGIPTTRGPVLTSADVYDPVLLARALSADDPLSKQLLAALPAAARNALKSFLTRTPANQRSGLPAQVMSGLDGLVNGASLWRPATAAHFKSVDLSADVQALAAKEATLTHAQRQQLNRGLLDESYPVALGLAALALADATVQLSRVTVLGRTAVHRLSASDSILAEFAAVDDTQDGCVRFSATTTDSTVPRQYESVLVAPGASLFTSTAFGEPGYAQLLEAADTAIVPQTGSPAAVGGSILTGADTGSEMGAYSAALNPIREQGLLVKFAEYMPLGLTPVIVHVT